MTRCGWCGTELPPLTETEARVLADFQGRGAYIGPMYCCEEHMHAAREQYPQHEATS